MRFNQVNQNQGNVSNAISTEGNVTQIFGAVDFREFTTLVDRSSLDNPVKIALTEARKAIEEGSLSDADKKDAAETLDKIREELGKPEKDTGRLKRLWDGLSAIWAPAGQLVGGVLKGYFGGPK